MRRSKKQNVREAEIHAELEYNARMGGASGLAYVPVVAGGERALTLHYVLNNQSINPGEMVLVDAGGLYKHYSSDISRTWPVNGKFTEGQRELYTAVLNANQQCIKVLPIL
jgi:Xaa-Pro aminopeptidase